MYYIIILVALIILYIFFYKIKIPAISVNNAIKYYEKNLKTKYPNVQISKIDKDKSIVKVSFSSSKTYYIKFVYIPDYSQIQINNKSTWEIKYGAGPNPGKQQPHKRYLNEIVMFMNENYLGTKIVAFTKKPKEIVKYINESEIIIVKPSTDVYGAYLTYAQKLDKIVVE